MKFSDQIKNRSAVYQKRMTSVFRMSVQDTSALANKTTAKGGRLRVDTGFLRGSYGAALGSMPSGPAEQGEAGQTGSPLVVVLAQWKPGDVVFSGWSANYALPREFIDGFMRGAAELWQRTVRRNVARAKREIK